jgi:hypothetical protein
MEFYAISNSPPPGTALNGELERTSIGIGIPIELNFENTKIENVATLMIEWRGRVCRPADWVTIMPAQRQQLEGRFRLLRPPNEA